MSKQEVVDVSKCKQLEQQCRCRVEKRVLMDSRVFATLPRAGHDPAHNMTGAILTSEACTIVFSADYPNAPADASALPLVSSGVLGIDATTLAKQSFIARGQPPAPPIGATAAALSTSAAPATSSADADADADVVGEQASTQFAH